MSTTTVEHAGASSVRPPANRLKKVLLAVVLAPLIAFIALGANALRLQSVMEQKRREVGMAGGRCEIERRVPAFVQMVAGQDFHTFLDDRVIVSVSMTGPKITDDRLASLGGLPDLEALDLQDASVTSAGLQSLANLKSLKQLNLANTQVTDLSALAALPRLESLKLDFSRQIQEEHLSALAELSGLRTLSAKGLRLRDGGVAAIAKCTQLEDLNIGGAILGDTGLAPLQQLKGLKRLILEYAQVSGDDLAALRAALPECQVVN